MNKKMKRGLGLVKISFMVYVVCPERKIQGPYIRIQEKFFLLFPGDPFSLTHHGGFYFLSDVP